MSMFSKPGDLRRVTKGARAAKRKGILYTKRIVPRRHSALNRQQRRASEAQCQRRKDHTIRLRRSVRVEAPRASESWHIQVKWLVMLVLSGLGGLFLNMISPSVGQAQTMVNTMIVTPTLPTGSIDWLLFLRKLNWADYLVLVYVLVGAIVAIIWAFLNYKHIIGFGKANKEYLTPKMQQVVRAIQEGSDSYIHAQFRKIIPVVVLMLPFVALSSYLGEPNKLAREFYGEMGMSQSFMFIFIAFSRGLYFIIGSASSLFIGWLGMKIATRIAVVMTLAAIKSQKRSMSIGYIGGGIVGFVMEAVGILAGLSAVSFFGFGVHETMLGFAFGSCVNAVFMRIGGGIYTKAADAGADVAGKIIADIPEDDPRNAATIADNVGDNVGDCAGMAADLNETYENALAVAFMSAVAMLIYTATKDPRIMILYLAVRATGIFSSITGQVSMRHWMSEKLKNIPVLRKLHASNPAEAMYVSYKVSSLVTVVITFFFCKFYVHDLYLWGSIMVGLLLATNINKFTAHLTGTRHRAVREVARSTKSGHASTIIKMLEWASSAPLGMAAIIVVAIMAVYWLWMMSGQPLIMLFVDEVAIGLGAYTHLANNTAMDVYGAAADNANGIREMSQDLKQLLDSLGLTHLYEALSRRLSFLDAIGNETKAGTKGIAISSAAITAISLIAAFILEAMFTEEVNFESTFTIHDAMFLFFPVLAAGMLGGALPYLFSQQNFTGVGNGAQEVIKICKEEFSDPDVRNWVKPPKYGKVVDVVTRKAQSALLPYMGVMLLFPIMVSMIFGVWGLLAFLVAELWSGVPWATLQAFGGAAGDNAKHVVEAGLYGGKGTECHKASVTADCVGDPLKDASGPALNPTIKGQIMESLLLLTALLKQKEVLDSYGLRYFIGLAVLGLIFLCIKAGIGKEDTSGDTDEDRKVLYSHDGGEEEYLQSNGGNGK